jgi:hypothetical protein
MNYYLSKLSSKIKNKKASILFIGENDFSTEHALNLSGKGYQVYFYNEKSISKIEELINNNIHLTNLVYDVFDVDVIFFSQPSNLNEIEINKYLEERLNWVDQFFHAGVLVLVDAGLNNLVDKPIKNSLEYAAYNDPASPIIQNFKVNENYFYLEFEPQFGKVINSDNEEVVEIAVELFRELI